MKSLDLFLLQELNQLKNYLYQENRFQIIKSEGVVQKAAPLKIEHSPQSPITELKEQVSQCTHCSLSQTRTQTVFSSGNDKSPLMIIGEAPGADEDKQGLPFVGSAGQLLNKMLKAIDLERDDVYVCNVLKCRPPGNRNPNEDEVQLCSPYLKKQIELVNPKIILTLGNFATKFILNTPQGISKLRGKSYSIDNRIVIPTYHPSALLHNESLKRPAWYDLKYLKLTLEKLKLLPLIRK